MKSILEVLNLSASYLKEKGIENPRRQAENLIADAIGAERLDLYLYFDRPLNEEELTKCREGLARRVKREPLQYIRGEVEFYHCKFKVNSQVLIPRQETEILVDKVVSCLSKIDLNGKVLWDICCGSGCIGIALKKQFPMLKVVLSDLSRSALEVAEENSRINEAEVETRLGDLLAPFQEEKADFVICNPPYIPESQFDGLDPEVKLYEPKIALIGGATGLEFYRRLEKELPQHLNPSAMVWFEMGCGQGNGLLQIFSSGFWKKKEVEKDWAGHDRFFFLETE